MNNDLISRETLKKVFNGYHSGIGSQPKFTLGACLQLIDNAPAVEPTFGLFRTMFCETCQAYATNRAIVKLADEYTRPQGEWIMHAISPKGKNYTCTACGEISITKFSFCPNCGAQMIGGEAE